MRQETAIDEQMIRRRIVECGRRIGSNRSEFEIGILILNRRAREREDLTGGALFPASLHPRKAKEVKSQLILFLFPLVAWNSLLIYIFIGGGGEGSGEVRSMDGIHVE